MQENTKSRRSSPQTRLISGLVAVAIFATALTFSSQLLMGTADALVDPPTKADTASTPKVTPVTTSLPAGSVFTAEVSPTYTPTISNLDTASVADEDTAAAPGETAAANTTNAAAGDTEELNISNVSTATSATFDPTTVGSTGASNIASYKAINSDVIGYLKVPNTNISFPVLYHPDSNYYLEKDIYKNWSRNGVIWADGEINIEADTLPRNTVLYGHNWTNISNNPRIGNANDVMFGQLTAFHHLSFAQQTPYIHYSTEKEEATWVVFAAFYTDINFNYILCYPNDTSFANIVSGAKARSQHIYDVEVSNTDQILTLSTCTRAFGSSANQRFVVMARKLRDGESTQTPITVTTNPSPIRPIL